MAQFFQIHPENPQRRLIHQSVEILRKGGVVAYPTDSSYALGCMIGNKEAMEKIEQLTGLRRSPDRVRVFLKSLGMECRKVGMVPAKADPQRQESFKKLL